MSEARFRIKRFDPASDTAPRYDTFVVPYEGNLTVLEGLFSIQERQDGSLSFRYCCRAAVCGSCAMYINAT
jgi:succinate dehydrogenase / fumarate reductase iron-sulfur subunit